MPWIFLTMAGLFEVGWPLGMKMAQSGGNTVKGIAFAVTCMALSGYLLYQAQRTIPMGTAYAVWTGIGAAGTFLVGVVFFGDASSLLRYMGVMLIMSGVVLLKFGG
ncbi:small multidrug resistance protein [Pseudogulbenkiania sp. NH8B]|uniref:Guanidinium exporter n=1 Tax=Pseudogulbenkiania ferrooxidans 2002 TaxID=279714 RepID=B9Z2G8_9NEIS|nr:MULTISPECIES: multidrug efflux SMR transporter [Pseudogulbenkiania]EEG08771.1 small multidrug resistance protein [Pseudogulbenkiania ferrooxidans 2002]BAK77473.1 small multidrug resistance protein [Pseudogulbenkiania sp. NH8B]